ncbi:hypothetical protein [Pseudomonas chlororaphis]|uniref:hypothetical protein n=1 Tax=Pseudomonas chlororaphis TaxID=587753 RepID=UPI002365E44B|nr:hypothetical protein [Pseudomonas chlororaphis]WDH22252.1 hypothetical protein PUP50_30520 [Pseudomonas chlororaphis]
MRRAISITVLSAVAGLAQAQSASPYDCSNFFTYGTSVEKTRSDFLASPETQAWNWFVCLNQPSAQGSPNRVWEGLKPSSQVFLPNGAPPQPYLPEQPAPDAVLEQARQLGMNLDRTFHDLDSTLQVDGLPLLMGGQVPAAQRGQPVRFLLQMGQGTFDYIVQKQVYNMNGQYALTSNLKFPETSWEVKTSWIWIGTDATFKQQLENDGYYVIQAYYPHQNQYQVGYAALSGMHVINKLSPEWIWTTFENVNNHKYTVTNAVPATPMTNTTGPTPPSIPVNSSFQGNYPYLSKYELIGVEFQPVTQVLANSQLESAFQDTSSCLACHGTAAYSKQKGYFNFAMKEDGGIVYPTTPLPASDFADYNKLDFVWSLKRAQWQR